MGNLDDDHLTELERYATTARQRFRRGSAGWAVTYHIALFGAAVLSAAAAISLQVPAEPLTELATVLSILAGLMTTVSGVGSFQVKWAANRTAFHELDDLLLDMKTSEPSAAELRQRLKDIRLRQRLGWYAESARPAQEEGD